VGRQRRCSLKAAAAGAGTQQPPRAAAAAAPGPVALEAACEPRALPAAARALTPPPPPPRPVPQLKGFALEGYKEAKPLPFHKSPVSAFGRVMGALHSFPALARRAYTHLKVPAAACLAGGGLGAGEGGRGRRVLMRALASTAPWRAAPVPCASKGRPRPPEEGAALSLGAWARSRAPLRRPLIAAHRRRSPPLRHACPRPPPAVLAPRRCRGSAT
jgi:hypothetical protein